MSTGRKPRQSAALGRNIERMNTVRIVVTPDPINANGFAASVWRTHNDGCTWQRGGTAHANTASHAEQDARRWILADGEDERVTVLTAISARMLDDQRVLGDLLNASLPNPIGAGWSAAA